MMIAVIRSLTAILLVSAGAGAAGAQASPGHMPDAAPTVKIGGVIFLDYTYQDKPTAVDADGHKIRPNSFNVTRAYVNVTGNLSRLIGFRITPDVARESGAGSSLAGSLTFRLKYAFGQLSLDDWLPKGSWIRLGLQQTPWIDYAEGIYRYRFQGPTFADREGYLTSSDNGVSLHAALPEGYGDLHAGVYNGEGYSKSEANNQKAFEIRGSLRPLPEHPILRGWRLTGFYDADHYLRSARRDRALFNTTFEYTYLNAGFDYLSTRDQPSTDPGTADLHGRGWSVWATPRMPMEGGSSVEALFRYDRMEPNHKITVVGDGTSAGKGTEKRTIAGVAYWFPHEGSTAAALLLDFEDTKYTDFAPARPELEKIALHGLISF